MKSTFLEGKSGVDEAATDAKYRMDILAEYLPKILSKEEAKEIARPLIEKLEIPSMRKAI